jgi:hypothetical protein
LDVLELGRYEPTALPTSMLVTLCDEHGITRAETFAALRELRRRTARHIEELVRWNEVRPDVNN